MIRLKKYRGTNYFDNPPIVDSMEIPEFHIDGVLSFEEIFEDDFESYALKASDFDIKFSLLQTTLSTELATIEQFLMEDMEDAIVACQITIGGKSFGGMIAIESITVNKTITQNRYDIRFTCYGFEKELAVFADCPPERINLNIGDITFSRLIDNQLFFGGLTPSYFQTDFDALDWVTKIGFEPVLVKELFYNLAQTDDLEEAARFAVTTRWELFKDLLKAFGIIYRFSVSQGAGNYFPVTMEFAFRDSGFNDDAVEIDMIEPYETSLEKVVNIKKYTFFKYAVCRAQDDIFYGVLYDGNAKDYARGKNIGGGVFEMAQVSGNEMIFNPQLNSVSYPLNEINIIEFSNYYDVRFLEPPATRDWVWGGINEISVEPTFTVKNLSFPAMFAKAGYSVTSISYGVNLKAWLIEHSSGIEGIFSVLQDIYDNSAEQAKMLLKSFIRKVWTVGMSLINHDDYRIFNETTIESTDVRLHRLSDYNPVSKSAKGYFKTII